MKYNKNIIILVACVVLVVIGVGYYYSTGEAESTMPGDELPAVVTDETTNPEVHTVMKPTIPPDESTEEATPKQ
jgi:hypothetical protein